jgi:uncharacterized protein GlcG (DUF336 family)
MHQSGLAFSSQLKRGGASMAGKALGISLEEARAVIRAGHEKAREIGVPMNIAVVDAGANLVAFERQDGAWIGSIDIAQKKAFTSRAFDIETKALGENSQSGEQFFGIHVSNQGKVMIFAGGVPLKIGDEVVGAVGVSGGMGKQDQAVAEAAASSFAASAKRRAA